MSDDGRTLTGYAAVFDSPSEPLPWIETIEPGAFTRTLAQADEVLALVGHDTDKLLGRRSAETLRLTQDDIGLGFEIDLPDTQLGRDVKTQIDRGDLKSMSFAFSLHQDDSSEEWGTDADGRRSRRLLDLNLHDVSVVSTPAFPAANVTSRSMPAMSDQTKMAEFRRLHNEMRAILSSPETTAEDQQKYDRLEERLSEVETDIKDEKRQETLDRAKALMDEPQRAAPSHAAPVSHRESREYSQAFYACLNGRATLEQRDMMTSETSGGNVVPVEMEKNILELLDDPTTMRGLCDVIQANGDVDVPVETALGGGGWVAEGGTISTVDVTIAKKNATPKTYSTGIVWSFQQAVQSVVNIDQYFGRVVGRRLAQGLNAGYVSGTGSSNQPEGLVTALSTPTYMDLANNGADEIIDAAHDLGPSYRTGAVWLMSDATLKSIRKLKVNSTDDAYVWQPSESYADIQHGTPGLLYGYPVRVDEDMPATQIVFGNMKRAYRIYDFGPTQILADPYSGASAGLTKLWAYRLTDGVMIDTNAAKLFDTDAS